MFATLNSPPMFFSMMFFDANQIHSYFPYNMRSDNSVQRPARGAKGVNPLFDLRVVHE